MSKDLKKYKFLMSTSISCAAYLLTLWVLYENRVSGNFISVIAEIITIPVLILTVVLFIIYVFNYNKVAAHAKWYYWIGVVCNVGTLSFIILSFI